MIASLRGTLTAKAPTEVTIDVHGVGYAVAIPLSTYERLGPLQSETFLFIHQHVREDALLLFGFATDEERAMFRVLLAVTGIGPKMAQGILSGIPVSELRAHLASGNTQALTTIPGIGRKLAERLVVELRDKAARIEVGPEPAAGAAGQQATIRQEALRALLSLGFNRPAADRALAAALHEINSEDAPLEHIIKAALRHTAK